MANTYVVSGRLGGEPERHGDVVHFSLADNVGRDHTQWIRVSTWGKTAELCQEYLAKGREVMISGQLKLGTYTNKDGEDRPSYDLNANAVTFLGSKDD